MFCDLLDVELTPASYDFKLPSTTILRPRTPLLQIRRYNLCCNGSQSVDNTHPKWWKDPGLRRNVFHLCGLCLCPFYLGCE